MNLLSTSPGYMTMKTLNLRLTSLEKCYFLPDGLSMRAYGGESKIWLGPDGNGWERVWICDQTNLRPCTTYSILFQYLQLCPYCKVSMIFVVSLFKDETKYHYDFRVCRPNSVKILQVCYILSSNYFQIKYFTSLCINIVDLFSFSFSMAFCFPFK